MVTPIAKSMPMTQASQMPIPPIVPSNSKDILEPLSTEQARTAYLERQIQGMSLWTCLLWRTRHMVLKICQ